MKRFFLSTIPLLAFFAAALAQTPGRLPVILKDSSAVIQGYTSSINIRNNYVVDSIHTNFHPNMPDTSTVTPLAAIRVAGPRISISFFHAHFTSIWGTASIIPTDSGEMAAHHRGMRVQAGPFGFGKTEYARILLNGKALFDWTPLDSFPKTLCKFYQETTAPGTGKTGWMSMYDFDYRFCDTTLAVGDQLLVEVKTEPQNWMVDRFMITRVASSPEIKATFSFPGASGNIGMEEAGGPSLEKKTSFEPISRN